MYHLNEDTLGHICKFHNISKREALTKLEVSPAKVVPKKPTD